MGVAKVTFIPHHTNNHWPLALRHRTLTYVSSFLVLTKIVAIAALALTPQSAELSTINEIRMVQLTNDARAKAGLTPLTVNSKLSQAAKLKGQDMLKHQYFAHISPAGVTPWFWMKKTGYAYQVAGENLAIDFLSAEDVVSAWLASPTHKANLLHQEYTETGIAVVSGEFQGGTSTIVIHMFGKPLHEEPLATESIEATPTTSPTPIPVVTIPPAPKNPIPRTPRIALLHQPTNENDTVSFQVEGEKNHALVLLIGNEERSITTLNTSDSQNISLPAKNLPKGTLVARVFARSVQGVESKISPAISFINPPTIIQYTLALSPAFDREQIALVGTSEKQTWQLYTLHTPLTINSQNINILPSFAIPENQAAKSFSASLIHTTRQSTSLIAIIVIILLAMAIFIRINIQHPALIMHASLVIFLAVILLVA